MLIMYAEFTVKRQEDVEAFRKATVDLMALTRKEPGCHYFHYAADLSDSRKFSVCELFEDEEALRTHFQKPYLQQFFTEVSSALVDMEFVRMFEVSKELDPTSIMHDVQASGPR